MAWIESFEIHGLAGRLDPVQHDLDRHLNIFWGLNGAGKTTLFRILHSAMSNDASSLEDLPFERAIVILRVGKDDLRVVRHYAKTLHSEIDAEGSDEDLLITADGELVGSWTSREKTDDSRWETTSDSDSLNPVFSQQRLNHCYLPITRVVDGGRRAPRFMDGRRHSPDEVFVQQVRDGWREYSARSLARIRDIQQQGLATVLAILFGGSSAQPPTFPEAGDVTPGDAYSLVKDFLREQSIPLRMAENAFQQRFEASAEHRQVVAEIQSVRHQTDEVLTPQMEFQSIIDSMFQGNKHLVLSSPRRNRPYGVEPIAVEIGERSIPLKSLSSGEKQLLQILLEVLGAGANSVIIDEPELSMHVNWQQQLVSSMRRVNDDCQLLLASHSPEIMADIADNYIFEL